jgi:transposase
MFDNAVMDTATQPRKGKEAPMKKLRPMEDRSQERGANTGGRPQGAPKAPAAGTDVYIGLDISSTKWAYAVRWDGRQQWQQTGPAELSHLLRLLEQYAHCKIKVVYEACGFGYEIAWQLRARGVEVVVTPPSCIARAPGLRVKNDRIDARKLAVDLENGTLKGIFVPSRELHEQRAPVRAYRQAIRDRGRSAARIRLLMQEHGLIGPRPGLGWSCYAKWLAKQEKTPWLQLCVEQHLVQRSTAEQIVRRLHQEVLKVGRLPEHAAVVKALCAQPGVGEFAATIFALEIGDLPARFKTADSIANYLGLTPSEYTSGEIEHRGATLKCGPGSVRALLVQCAWAAVNCGGDRKLLEVYARLMPRAGKKRAIIAVARRLVLRLRARWLEAVAQQSPEVSAIPA